MTTTWTLGSTDLSTYGIGVTEETGLLDLVGLDTEEVILRGRDALVYADKRRQYPQATLGLLVTGATEADAISNFSLLRYLVSPARGWQALSRSDIASRYLYVRGRELVGSRSASDGPTVIRTELVMDRMPYWQATSETLSNAITGASGTITNAGDVSVYPTWEITFSGASSGFAFAADAYVFAHTGTFAGSDVLYVDAANYTVKKGTSTFVAGVNTTTTTKTWPYLHPGPNTITVSAGSNYSLRARYTKQYE